MKLFKKAKPRFRTPNNSQNPSPVGSQVSSSNLLANETRNSVWEGVKTALRLIKDSADAFPPLKSTVGGLLGIIDIIENAGHNAEEAGRIQLTLNAMATAFKASALKSPNGSGDASVRINGLVASIDEQILLVQSIAERNKISSLANATKDKEEIGAVVRKISDLLNTFLIETCLSTEVLAVETFEVVSKAYLKEELKPVYEAFYTADGPVPRRLCTPKTRAEILTAMIGWATTKDDKRIYCLSGMAGTGKTTIVNTLCRILERSGLLGGSFFCSRADIHCSNANRIIPSIAYQLALRFPSFRSQVTNALEDMEKGSTERSFRHLLVEPLKACIPEITRPVVIVIDALDECGNENQVTTLLSHLWAHSPSLSIKFLLTFRPDRVFQSTLRLSDSTSTKIHLHDVEESLVGRDIRLFLEERLRQLAEEQRSRGIEVDVTWPTEAELKALHSQAGKLFIYAATTCEYIGGEGIVTERLSQVIQMGRKPTALQASSIDELYTSILDEATRKLEQMEKDRLLRILSAVVYAQKTLTIQTLASLLSFKAQEIIASLTRLHSVLHLHSYEGDMVISTFHASFPDYLGDSKRSQGYFCDLVKGNTMLSYACLATMDTLRENICDLEQDSIPDRTNPQKIPESLQYACQYWLGHCYFSDLSGTLLKAVNHFFSTHVLHWVECLSLLGVLYPSIPALQTLETRTIQADNKLRPLLYDLRRFIAQNIELLKSNPLETYKSALLWLPKESLIRKQYFSELSLPKIVSGLPNYWDSCEMVLLGHTNVVNSVALSSDGSHIISGDWDCTVRVWNSATGELEHELIGHASSVISVAFLSKDSQIVSTSVDCTIRVWNSATGELERELIVDSESLGSVAISPDGIHIASSNWGKTIRVCDLSTGELEHELTGHSDTVMSIAFSPDGSRLVSNSSDKTTRVWNSATGELEYELIGHSDPVSSVKYPLDGSSTPFIMDQNIPPTLDLTIPLRSVAFSPDCSCIVSVYKGKTIRVWNLSTGELEHELIGHSRSVTSITFSPDGSHIASSSYDCTIRVWNWATGELAHELIGHSDAVTSVAFSSDGSYIVSGSLDGTVRVWNSSPGESEHGLTGHPSVVYSVAFSSDGSSIVSGSSDKAVRVWNSSTGELRHELTGHSDSVRCVAFSPNGSRIVSGSEDKTIRVWNSATGESERELTGHSDSVICIAFSPDGSRVASGSDDKIIRVWNSETGELAHKMTGHSSLVSSVAFSPDGSYIVSGSYDNTIRVWSSATKKLERELTGRASSCIRSVAFSPDGSRIISSTADEDIVRVWDMDTGESEVLLTSLRLPDQTVLWSQPGGRYLMILNDQSVAPRPVLYLSEDARWLISSKQSRYWIPPSYSLFSRWTFFDNMAAVITYPSGLIILGVDK